MLIAQLSDLHLCAAGPRSSKNIYARQAVDLLLRLKHLPDVVIVTGDVTEDGTEREYALFQDVIEPLPMPVHAIPGNHDRREAMRAALGLKGEGALHQVIDTRPVRIVALDTLIPGRVEGMLDAEALRFLAAALEAAPDVPTVVALHHPPFRCGLAEKDSIRLFEGADELASILARHGQVERVVAGHLHRSLQARFGGTLAQVAPPVRYLTPTERREPAGEDEPPGFLLHRWIEGQGIATRMVPLAV